MRGGDLSTATVTRRTFLRTAGGATATAATAGAAAGQDETTTEGETTGGGTTTGEGTPGETTEGTDGGGGGGGASHTVDMTDDLVFDPEEITIAPGDTVVWENVGQVEHSVTGYEDEIPDGAEYFASGGFDSEQPARDAYPDEGAIAGGESYEHTFETEGEFGYFCIPHESVGMVGTVIVQAGGGGGGEGGGATGGPSIPASAMTLGIISMSALLAVLALAYVFLKYGGDYGEVER